MPQAARITDEHRGICNHGAPCCPHSVVGEITEGSPDAYFGGLKAARLGDGATHNCPHCGTGNISSASRTVNVNGKGVARLGDEVTYPGGSGVITTAGEKMNIGG